MKIGLLFTLALLGLLLAGCGGGQDDPKLYTFNIDKHKVVYFTRGYSGDSHILKLPSKDTEGRLVECIGIRAFAESTKIRDVTIPDSIKEIKSNAFSDCPNLKSVTIPGSVKFGKVTFSIFENCTSLESVKLGNGIEELPGEAFENCTSLKSITLPDTIKEIRSFAFSGCTNLKSIVIPEKVEEIEDYTFSGCTNLKSIVIPKNLKKIGACAFADCTNLKEIKIPKGVIIEERPFQETFRDCPAKIIYQ